MSSAHEPTKRTLNDENESNKKLKCSEGQGLVDKEEKGNDKQNVHFQPQKYKRVLVYLAIKDCYAAIRFYTEAFQAKEDLSARLENEGSIVHSELAIGDTVLMLSEENASWGTKSPTTLGGPCGSFTLYVPSVDWVLSRCVSSDKRVTVLKKAQNQFWGERHALIQDPFGYHWSLQQIIQTLSIEQMQEEFNKMTGPTPEDFPLIANAPSYKPSYHQSMVPYLYVKDCGKAVEYYKRVFGFSEKNRFALPESFGGTIVHCELALGDSALFLSEEQDQFKSPSSLNDVAPFSLCVYVPNVDDFINKIIGEGCKLKFPVSDHFYGARAGSITDPFGFKWNFQTQIENLTSEEISVRGNKVFGSNKSPSGSDDKSAWGSCLCGSVGFQINFPTKFVAHCHCTICQRAHAAGVVSWVGVKKSSGFKFLKGADMLSSFQSSSSTHRYFCNKCGSSIYSESTALADEVHIPLALFGNAPLDQKPTIHIFCKSRAEWLNTSDSLPRFDEFPTH